MDGVDLENSTNETARQITIEDLIQFVDNLVKSEELNSEELSKLQDEDIRMMTRSLFNTYSFPDLVRYYSYLRGEPYENMFAQLLMTVSRNIGPFLNYPLFPSVNARANVIIILIGPAGVLHRSTTINREDEMSRRVADIVREKYGFISEIAKSKSIMFQGSPEGLVDELLDVDIIHCIHDDL